MCKIDPNDRLLTTAVGFDRCGISKTTGYREIKAGRFPQPVPIGQRRVGFLESEINAWIENRLRLRDEGFGAEARRESAIRAVGGRQ